MYKVLLLVLLMPLTINSQNIFGKWKTIDDETGEAKSTVEIYKKDGKVFGKIIEIYNSKDRDALCANCEGTEYNKPVLGLTIIKNLTQDGIYFKNGTIFDPEDGKTYKCRLSLDEDNPDILLVRGYISFLYATQYWERIES
ncbi:DUF2147 domain-containing protein [Xanthomarina spongicola]|uniref:Uncharacterized protein (DUF2147 family) n=1 Tax=Xanthomarina spongicola TaxID=570520 RepID=A0A316DJY3_9FLAO|nr:DUF2147 domain-containing protein [Xanthomarina spongicola]PWK17976.1 uncharacterized protein (DUF2147 family) [Xanthomarina spongicola]